MRLIGPFVVAPGDEIAMVHEFQASIGTYQRDDRIYASVVGFRVEKPQSQPGELPLLQVIRHKETTAIPEVDSTITGRVVRIDPRMATLEILAVGNVPCSENFQGVIRTQDVRATEKDKIQIYKCFRPGDIVRAQVISLGDARSYFLSTAKNDLGVVFASSAAGHTMIPISWEEMMCPVTKAIEYRKCAKPTELTE